MLREGGAQGFHVNYFYKGHGPTDFERWAAAATEETATGKQNIKTSKGLVLPMCFGYFLHQGGGAAGVNFHATVVVHPAFRHTCPCAGL